MGGEWGRTLCAAVAKYRFVVVCPNDHLVVQDGYERDDLQGRVRAQANIRLFCSTCDAAWNAAPDLIESIRRSLEER
jgi:hypothetical protein